MRMILVLLAAASVSACDRKAAEPENAVLAAKPVQISFEGADYKDDLSKVFHGKRLAEVLDCTGCHGDNLQGTNVTADDPGYGDMNAPNITLLLAKYSDGDLERLIRRGEPKDGREFWFMPVESLQFLSDADLAALMAYLRTFKPAGQQLPPIKKGKGFFEDIDRGFGNARQQVDRYKKVPPLDVGPQYEKGRGLVRIVCTACHNGALQGYEGFAPNLDIAGSYTKAELMHLLTTGEGKTRKDLGMMSEVVRNHLSHLTPGEREAMVDYVLARANRPQQASSN